MDKESLDFNFNGQSKGTPEECIDVTIYGNEYNIKTVLDREYAEKLARLVDKKMWNIAESNKLASTTKIAVLTALHIAHELFQLKSKFEREKKVISEKTKNIISIIDKYS
ncbi:MAG: cell division protein ZapA [bacterium]